MELALPALYQQASTIDQRQIGRWSGIWVNAWHGPFEVPKSALLRFGILLGRVAEAYARNDISEEVLHLLAESVVQNVGWIPEPATVLLTAGEFNRRSGNLDHAENRYNQAVQVLERELVAGEHRAAVHKELGRLFYELAVLHTLRGDAGAERSAYERSEIECNLAGDDVGAVIARTGLSQILLEEGSAEAAVQGLTACASLFEGLVEDPKIEAAGRRGFAQRWVFNARFSLVNAHLAAGDCATGRRLLDEVRSKAPAILSTYFSKVIEAKICLAEGDLAGADKAIGESWTAIEDRGGLETAESAAGTVAISGVIHALGHSMESARSSFGHACGLRRDLRNSTAQGWAWAGRAILARDAGNVGEFWSAVHQGLSAVERCGAPVRAFLQEALRNSYGTEQVPDMNDLKALVCRSGSVA